MATRPVIASDAEPYSAAHLMAALEFNAEDLSANQAGYLSEEQRLALQRISRLSCLGNLGCMGLTFPIAGIIVFPTGPFASSVRLSLMVLIMSAPAVFMAYCVYTFFTLRRNLTSNHVNSITGPIRRSTSTSKHGTTYTLSIWAKDFTVSKEIFQAFAGGWIYTLYFASTLLSAEFVSDETLTMAPEAYLRWALRIGPKDIEANAAGDLSESQRRTFEIVAQSYWNSLVGLALVIGVLLTVGFSVWWPQPSLRLAVLILLCGLGVLGFFVASTMRANQHSRVESIRGRVVCTDSTLVINEDRLMRVGALAAAFVSGKTYTIYYVPLKTGLFDSYDPIVAAVCEPGDEQEHTS